MLCLKRSQTRTETGSLAVLIPGLILVTIVGLGAFAMDISHNVTVRTELQSATDAAALAGARDFLSQSTDNNAESDALTVAEQNTADGSPVSTAVNGCTVTPVAGGFDNSTNSQILTVDASKQINNTFAKLMGHNQDTINGHSVAQAWRSVTGVEPNQMFPMTVSLDTTIGHADGVPLYKKNIGDKITFYTNSQQYKNSAWTSFNVSPASNSYISSAVDQVLGMAAMQPGFVPGMNAGDTMYLDNGTTEEKRLAGGNYISTMTDPNRTLILPVMMGDPPYNQTSKVVGFITVKITNVNINGAGGKVQSFDATIVKMPIKGTGSTINTTGSGNTNKGLQNISAGTVKLVS